MNSQDLGAAERPAEPGARLRARREQLGMSEQQAAEQLSLDSSAVAALESNDFAALGVPVFARGHLRRYAALLGLPANEVLESYDRSRSQPGQPSLIPKSRLEMVPVRTRTNRPLLVGSAFLFLVAAALAAYISNNGLRLPGRAGPKLGQGSSATVPAESVVMAEQTPPQGVPTDLLPQGAGGTTTAQAAGAPAVPPVATRPGEVTVRLSFAADSWVEIYDGSGKAVVYDLGLRGTQRVVVGAAPLSVTLGNAPAVTMQVNGRRFVAPVPPAGQTVARFGIGPDGSLR